MRDIIRTTVPMSPPYLTDWRGGQHITHVIVITRRLAIEIPVRFILLWLKRTEPMLQVVQN